MEHKLQTRARYIKRRMGEDLKNQILARNGIISELETKQKPSIHVCGRCEFVNAIDNKYCSKCSYPLTPLAYEEIKLEEDKRIKKIEEKQQEKESEIQTMKEQINSIINALSTITNQNHLNETAKLLYNAKILNVK